MSQQISMRSVSAFWTLIMAAALVAAVSSPFAATTAHAAPEAVAFQQNYPLGAIVVVNKERRLYYVVGKGRALRYSVAVGKPENQWTGQLFVASRAKNPSWTSTTTPGLTVGPGPANPLGVRALYLGWTNYRIHGTNAPGSIGSAASGGCFRMQNVDVVDLYERSSIGAPVIVVDALTDPASEPGTAKLTAKSKGKAARAVF